MDNRSIGVFDSGLGGLTAVKELKRLLPYENIIYFGDTSRVPYGTRSNDTIIKYVKSDIAFLNSKNIKLCIAACGTASSVALPLLCDKYDFPLFGVVEAAAISAAKMTKNKKIGVIGTPGTVKSKKYEEEINKHLKDAEIYSKACPLFVPIVENGYADSAVADIISKDYLFEIKEKGVDTLILGCTHYPLLENAIKKFMGNINIVSPGKEISIFTKEYLTKNDMLSNEGGLCKYFVSDSVDNFSSLAEVFLGEKIEDSLNKIDIEEWS